jgi:hypothetical protein
MTIKIGYKWVEAEEFERVSGSFPNTIHSVQIPRIGGLFDIVDTYGDENRWIEICAKIQFNLGLIELQNKEQLDVLKEYQDIFAWHKGELEPIVWGSIPLIHKDFLLVK